MSLVVGKIDPYDHISVLYDRPFTWGFLKPPHPSRGDFMDVVLI